MPCERWLKSPIQLWVEQSAAHPTKSEVMKSVKTEFWVCSSVMSNLSIQVSQYHSPPNFSVTAQEVAFSLLCVHIVNHIIFICGRQWMMEFMWGLTFIARISEEKFLISQNKISVTCEEVLSECVKVAWELNCREQTNSYIPGKCSICMW
jgi:hypothetical protein